MTPEDKAKELFDKMLLDWSCNECHNHWAKECALIAVDEILDASLYYFDELSLYVIYWQEVKNEINKL